MTNDFLFFKKAIRHQSFSIILPFLSILTIAILTACSSVPQHNAGGALKSQKSISSVAIDSIKRTKTITQNRRGYYLDDGPEENPPADLHLIPDPIPKHEPLRLANMQPYVALGKQFKPMTTLKPYKQRGIASWYGRRYHGNNTALGEVYDMYAMTAAHPTLPLPSYARVTNLDNGKSVIVRLNDRGPFLADRLIDLSYTAAHKLDIIANGSGRVEVESILPDNAPLPAIATYGKSQAMTPPSVNTVELRSIYLQLGAFGSVDNAHSFLAQAHQKLPALKDTISISKNNGLYKIHVGPYRDQVVASLDAGTISQRLGVKPLLIVD